MRAVVYDTSGAEAGRLRMAELPEPSPAEGEVRVRVTVSGVNPTDWKARDRGGAGPWVQQIPNQDGAGVIDQVGEGVSGDRIGQRVWVYHAADRRPSGTAAEFVCLPQSQVVKLPDGISFDHGAGLGIPGITAHRCLYADGPVGGLQVLVTGGAGAVGHAAIQLARFGGARVIATVSTPEKARLATDAGAETVLNYREPGFADRLRTAADGSGIDRVVDVAMATNLRHYVGLLNQHVVAACYAREEVPISVTAEMLRVNALLRFVYVYNVPQLALDQAAADITSALQVGELQPLPTHRFSLESAEDAHAACRRGLTGKILIDVANG